MPSTFVCIYCTLSKPDGQTSKEQLLQRSLGGDLTAQFVCRDCNSGFSKIDQALSDPSTVALSRVAKTASTAHRVKAGGITTHYDKDRDLFIEVELRNQLMPVVLPQLHLRPDGKGEFIALDLAAAEQVIEFIDQNLAAGTMGSVHRFYGCPMERQLTQQPW
jgi:HNH endonuclease